MISEGRLAVKGLGSRGTCLSLRAGTVLRGGARRGQEHINVNTSQQPMSHLDALSCREMENNCHRKDPEKVWWFEASELERTMIPRLTRHPRVQWRRVRGEPWPSDERRCRKLSVCSLLLQKCSSFSFKTRRREEVTG